MVSALEAQKMLVNGCEAFLAYVINLDMKEVKPCYIITVCDFPGVFPEELPGLLSN